MEYSRRNFMKAAGVGAVAVTTSVRFGGVGAAVAGAHPLPAGAPAAPAAKPSPLEIPTAITKETSSFNINGKVYQAEYEARTTLWEVIAVKLGLDRDEPQLQPRKLRSVQRAAGWNAVLLLPHAGV